MAYLVPSEFVTKMVDAGESKIFMSTRDTLIRAFMAGAILSLAAAFSVTINVQTGQPLAGAVLFPVGFCMLYLLGFDLLTGVFVLSPLALIDKRPGVTLQGVLRNWGLVFVGNFAGALTVAVLMAITFTYGFSVEPNAVGKAIGVIGEKRTLGYAEYGAAGMLTLFVRGMLCNWMVSTGVVGAMISTTVGGKVLAHEYFDSADSNLWVACRSLALRCTQPTLKPHPSAACAKLPVTSRAPARKGAGLFGYEHEHHFARHHRPTFGQGPQGSQSGLSWCAGCTRTIAQHQGDRDCAGRRHWQQQREPDCCRVCRNGFSGRLLLHVRRVVG